MYVSPSINLANVGTLDNQTTLLARLSAARALGLDYLDQYVSSAEQRKLVAGGPGAVLVPYGVPAPMAQAGAADHYGAWTQLDGALATALVAFGARIVIQNASGGSTYGEYQIGVGAGGAEVVQTTEELPVVPNADYPYEENVWTLPLPLAAGVRVAWRVRGQQAGEYWRCTLRAVNPANDQKWSA